MKSKKIGFLFLFLCVFVISACTSTTTATTTTATNPPSTTSTTTASTTTTTTTVPTTTTTTTTTTVTTTQVPVASVVVVGQDTVEVGESTAYTAIFSPAEAATTSDVIWSVIETTGSATITALGILTPTAPGTITVKATVKGVEGTLVVVITQAVDSVSITGPAEAYLGTNETYEFVVTPATATYESTIWAVLSGSGSATITQDGVLTPVAAGTVTVRINIDGVLATKVVTIKTPVASIEVQGAVMVRMEETPLYSTVILPVNADYDAIVWSVENGTGSATISVAGVLTPTTSGTIKVVATVGDIKGELAVELIVSVDAVTVVGETSILPGDRPVYEATVLPSNAKYPNITWSVIDGTGSATISQTGVLTPVSSGTITVVATADSISEQLEVTIHPDDRLLGTPRPTHLIATPENTIFMDGAWEKQSDLVGLNVTFARQVYDISFTAEASRSSQGVQFNIPNNIDISRMQYFAIKVSGSTTTPGVNLTVSVQLRDFDSGLNLYNDQVTEIEVTSANQWIVFAISNRYRLQAEYKDLKILIDPHFTASGNEGVLTIQQVVFFGNADAVTTPEFVTPLKNAHWEATGVTAEPAVDQIDGLDTNVLKISATAAAVSGWKAIPAYVLEDISRVTTISFKVKLLTSGLSANPMLLVTLGDTDLTNVAITRPAVGVDPVYQTVTVTIPANLRTEANMWAARYIQLKVNGGGGAAVEYYIYDFKLTGNVDPTPVSVTRQPITGPNVNFTSAPSYVENGTHVAVAAAGDVPAHRLWTPTVGATLSKLQMGYTKSAANLASRSGLNGLYVKIQGQAGITVNLQQNWGDGWADASQRVFVLDGTVQEIYILATTRTLITAGTSGTVAWQFNASIPADAVDVTIKVFTVAFTAIQPIPELIKEQVIHFGRFIEGGNTLVTVDEVTVDTLTVSYPANTNAVATVALGNSANHIVATATSNDLRYMTHLTLKLQGEIGTKVTIKLAYGNAFNMDVDYVHEFTTNSMETITIVIQDRNALQVGKISVSLFFNLNGVTAPVNYTVFDAYFSGQNPVS